MELLWGLIAIQELLISLKLTLFCYTRYGRRDRRIKGEGRAKKARKRNRGRVPLDGLNYEAIAGSVLVLYPHSSFVLFIREGGQEGQPAFSFKHRETFMRK